MVRHVRIDEVVTSIAVASRGSGRVAEQAVVRDLQKSIGATKNAASSAIRRAIEHRYINRDGGEVRLIRNR